MKYYLITYKNWKGEVQDRNILPLFIEYGNNPYHLAETWLLYCQEIITEITETGESLRISDKIKSFDMKNILEVKDIKWLKDFKFEYSFDRSVLEGKNSSDQIEYLISLIEYCESNRNKEQFKVKRVKKFYDKEDNRHIKEIIDLKEDLSQAKSKITKLVEFSNDLIEKLACESHASYEKHHANLLDKTHYERQISSMYQERSNDMLYIASLIKDKCEKNIQYYANRSSSPYQKIKEEKSNALYNIVNGNKDSSLNHNLDLFVRSGMRFSQGEEMAYSLEEASKNLSLIQNENTIPYYKFSESTELSNNDPNGLKIDIEK